MDASIILANPKGTSVLSIEYPDRPNVLAGVDGNGPIHTVALETVWGLRNPTNGSWCEEKHWSHSCCGPMRSVPHRGGSGWVLRSDFNDWKVPVGPTRYPHGGTELMGPQLEPRLCSERSRG